MAESTGGVAFPSHQIPTKKKGYEWILQFTKAFWGKAQGLPAGYWYINNNNKFDERALYAMGKQRVDRYKKGKKPTDIANASAAAIDNSPLPIMGRFVDIIESKLLQQKFQLGAKAVDELSRTEEDDHFDQLKAKILMRQQLQQMGSPLANSPQLAPQPGEPQDTEELQMQRDFSYKHLLAQKAEIGLDYLLHLNNFPEQRKKVVRDLVVHGIGGYKRWIDEQGMVRCRDIKAKWLVPSFCYEPDFSDMISCGEVRFVYIGDLIAYYSPEQIQKICQRYVATHGNPASYIPAAQKGANAALFKVPVWDFEFYSWNTTVYEQQPDAQGIVTNRKSDYSNLKFVGNQTVTLPDGTLETIPAVDARDKGQPAGAGATYASMTKKVVYKCEWIIGTDMMHNWGLKQNMNRKYSNLQDTCLAYHLYAWRFHEMTYTGLAERLIPVADDFQQTWLKLQELKRTLIPYLVKIDLTMLESVALSKGGMNMTPQELTNFLFETGVMVWRSDGGVGQGINNYNPASMEASGQLQAFTVLTQNLLSTVSLFYQLSGLNEATADAPNPDSNQLNITAANQATSNALYLISDADKHLQMRLSDCLVQDLQIAVKLLGKVEGYTRALGRNTMQFFRLGEEFAAPREFGIFIEEVAGSEERQLLYQRLLQSDSQGLLDPSVWVTVERINNLDEAAVYLSYQIKKAKDRMQQEQQANIQAQTQGNLQNAQQAAQLQERQMLLAHQLKLEEIAATLQGQFLIEQMKKGEDVRSAEVQAEAKKFASVVQANAKVQTAPKQLSF